MGASVTRRELVVGAGAGAGATALAPAGALAAPGGDGGILIRTLEVEQLLVFSYRTALGSGALTAAVQSTVRELLGHELVHVATLEQELARLGSDNVPSGPADVAAAQRQLASYRVHRSLSRLHSQHDCLRLLIDVESIAEGAYFTAIAKLSDPELLRIATEVLGCEAQHWTLLSSIQHHGDVKRAVPYPFVGGPL